MTGSLRECDRNVVAGAGPDDENTRRRALAQPLDTGKSVLRVVVQPAGHAPRELVRHAVDVDVDGDLAVSEVESVVNDPVVSVTHVTRSLGRSATKSANRSAAREQHRPLGSKQRDEEHDEHHAPREWRCTEQG